MCWGGEIVSKRELLARMLGRILLPLLFLGLLLILAVVCYQQLAIAGMQFLAGSFDSPICNSGNANFSMESLEQALGVEFPHSVANIWSQCVLGQESTAEVKFELHPDELDTFISTTNISPPLSATDTLPLSSFFSIFHSPLEDEIKQLDMFLYGTAGSKVWQEDIAVDTRQPDRWIVYFMVWTD